MATIQDLFATGFGHHEAGRLPEAEQFYRQILAAEPGHIATWHLLGMLAQQVGNHDVAIACLRRAVELKPDYAEAYSDLGTVLTNQGKIDEAVACFQSAIRFKPDYADAHYNLGNSLNRQEKIADAIACYRRALALRPQFVEALYNLGHAQHRLGKTDEAIASYRQVLELKPDMADASLQLGDALRDQGNWALAITAYRRALALKPDHAEAWHNLGTAYWEQKIPGEAIACYGRALALSPNSAQTFYNLALALQHQGNLREAAAAYQRAIELAPNIAEAHNNLGNVLRDLGLLEDAVACCRRAVEINPGYAAARLNLGFALQEQGRLNEAADCYRQTLDHAPDFVEAQWCQAVLTLLLGDFARGWREFECRWQRPELPPRGFEQPLWQGETLQGKTILLHAEQGLGDTIQFLRYVPLVKNRGATVLLECQQALLPLLANYPVDHLIGRGDDLPAFDVQVPLMSLPGIFQTTLENIPAQVPYLFAAAPLVEQWKERLKQWPGYRIGIAWQGKPDFVSDRRRSFRLSQFSPLAQLPGVRLISLQKGFGAEQLQEVRNVFSVVDLADQLDEAAGPFMDTAAVMRNMDLVITSDTSLAHLAGALGVPTWVALPFIPDWRWLLDRDDSPWYPTMRLFRQQSPGDWAGVFERIQAALSEQRLGG